MMDQTIELRGEWIALNDLLKVAGVSDSGGAAKSLIASGAVLVDDLAETRKTKKIRAGQVVVACGIRINLTSSSS